MYALHPRAPRLCHDGAGRGHKGRQAPRYGLDVLSNTGAYASHGHSIAAAGGSKVCYVYPHATYRFSAKTFYSNIPVGGACRGYGSPQTAYAIECLMDDTARALGMDPLDFRLKNTGATATYLRSTASRSPRSASATA